MPAYKAPLRDMRFLMNEVFDYPAHYAGMANGKDADPDTVSAILDECAKFCEEVLSPLNLSGDEEGCHFANGEVKTPKGFKEAYDQYVAGGWQGLSHPTEYGGQGLPMSMGLIKSEMMGAANWSFTMYPGLSLGAMNTIMQHAPEDLKNLYMPPLTEGRWTGTMCLTEPQCGTDLGQVKTRAEPQADGSYKITGTKIFISAGEHDLAENIVHIVLARLPDAPAGTRGISLFIVPKMKVKADGGLDGSNKVVCSAIEHKMGIRASATAVINFEESTGHLIAEPNKGLEAMFTFMNTARIGTAVQGIAHAELSYQGALAYAKERRSMRALSGKKEPEQVADAIIHHADVRRMLLESRALIEGGRAFLLWGALQADLQHVAEDEKGREKASDYMGLLTPVIKAYLTDKGLKVTSDAMQVHGGSGFTEHFPASQYMRDVRITLIYEGTNGVQALDLVGRKLPSKGGRALQTFLGEVDAYVAAEEGTTKVPAYIKALKETKAKLMDGTMWLMQNGMGNPDNAAAGSLDYLHLFGLTCMSYMWAMMAKAAQDEIDNGSTDPFFASKLKVGRVFLERILPDADAHLAKMKGGAEALMALEDELF